MRCLYKKFFSLSLLESLDETGVFISGYNPIEINSQWNNKFLMCPADDAPVMNKDLVSCYSLSDPIRVL